MSTEIKKLQERRVRALEKSVEVLFKGAMRRWTGLPPSLRIRKLQALSKLLTRDIAR